MEKKKEWICDGENLNFVTYQAFEDMPHSIKTSQIPSALVSNKLFKVKLSPVKFLVSVMPKRNIIRLFAQ